MNIKDFKLKQLIKREGGILTTSELRNLGISDYEISRLRRKKVIENIYRGIYKLDSFPDPQHEDFIPASKRVKNGVICHISALNFHLMTLQRVRFVDIAIQKNTYKPKILYPPTRYFSYPPGLLNTGVLTIKEPGLTFHIFNKEKCLVDCLVFEEDLYHEIVDDAFSMYLTSRGKCDLKRLRKYAGQFGVAEKLEKRLKRHSISKATS